MDVRDPEEPTEIGFDDELTIELDGDGVKLWLGLGLGLWRENKGGSRPNIWLKFRARSTRLELG